MNTPKHFGFEYEVKLAVSIPLAWAKLLKETAKHHYDYKCRESAERGVVNALYNTAQGGPLNLNNYAVSWSNLDLIAKVAEQLQYHTRDDGLILTIRAWIRETKLAIERRQEACEALPGSRQYDCPSDPTNHGQTDLTSH